MSFRNRSPTTESIEMELQSLGTSMLDVGISQPQHPQNEIPPIKQLPSNNPMKTLCLLYMMGSAVIAVTGRGVIFVLLGIIGIVFSVEGFYGVANYDRAAIIRVRNLFEIC
jgi:hypothetical protein